MSSIFVAYGRPPAFRIRVALMPFILIEIIIFLLTAAPMTPAGWRAQEVAYAKLFITVGVPANEAIALSFLFKLAVIAVALPGGALFASLCAGCPTSGRTHRA